MLGIKLFIDSDARIVALFCEDINKIPHLSTLSLIHTLPAVRTQSAMACCKYVCERTGAVSEFVPIRYFHNQPRLLLSPKHPPPAYTVAVVAGFAPPMLIATCVCCQRSCVSGEAACLRAHALVHVCMYGCITSVYVGLYTHVCVCIGDLSVRAKV